MSKLLAVTPQCSMLALTPRRSNAPAAIVPQRRNHQKRPDPYRGNDPYKGNVRFDPTVKIVRFDPTVKIVRLTNRSACAKDNATEVNEEV